MKRFLAFVLVVVLAFSVTVASASAIKIKGLSEKALYELYSEIQSQMQLNQLRKKVSYEPVKNFDSIERNPDNHKGKLIYFEGTILQAVEGNLESTYRVAFGGNSDKVFLVSYSFRKDALTPSSIVFFSYCSLLIAFRTRNSSSKCFCRSKRI